MIVRESRKGWRWMSTVWVCCGFLTAVGEIPADWRAARPKWSVTNQEPASSASQDAGGALATFNAALKDHRAFDPLPLEQQRPVPVLQRYEASALQGHAPALVNLGGALEIGWGCPGDKPGSLVNYGLAAQLGHPLGEYNWARAALLNPELADASRQGVNDRLERAAEAGVREAAYLRGWTDLRNGQVREAAAWFLSAAQQGFPEAAYALGWLNASRTLPGASRAESLRWFQTAEDGGLATASFALGRLLHDGDESTPPDFHKAEQHLLRAANAQLAEAQYMLGFYRYHGRTAPADRVDAYRWLSLSARSGFAPAVRARDGLGQQLSPLESQQAVRLIQTHQPRPSRPFQWSSTASMVARASAQSTRLPGVVVNDSGWVVGWGGELPKPPVTGRIVTASGRVACREVLRSTRDGLILLQVEGIVPPWRPIGLRADGETMPDNAPVRFAAVDPSGPPDSDRWFARLKWESGRVSGIESMPSALRQGVVLDEAGRMVSLATGDQRGFLGIESLSDFLRQAGWVPPKAADAKAISKEGVPEGMIDSLVHLELTHSP